ncbi:hypothetical protein YC2023_085266 [Brassica napus]
MIIRDERERDENSEDTRSSPSPRKVTNKTHFSSPQIRVSVEQGGRWAENENLSPIFRQTRRRFKKQSSKFHMVQHLSGF